MAIRLAVRYNMVKFELNSKMLKADNLDGCTIEKLYTYKGDE